MVLVGDDVDVTGTLYWYSVLLVLLVLDVVDDVSFLGQLDRVIPLLFVPLPSVSEVMLDVGVVNPAEGNDKSNISTAPVGDAALP